MLTLILGDTELELVPVKIQNHPSVVTHAKIHGKKTSDILLDSSIHHSALKKLRGSDDLRRGRPDIAHQFLLLSLDSILNAEGKLKVIMHTRNNDIIKIMPETRIPKNYNRFVGLMEQLFEIGKVPPDSENPLMHVEKGVELKTLVENLNIDRTIALSPDGKPVKLGTYFTKLKEKDIACIIGGFPEGDFHSPIYEIVDDKISIHKDTLKVWTVTSELIVNYELTLK
jgi:rRNA small subunit pseudouridine methyltransferase Nep1